MAQESLAITSVNQQDGLLLSFVVKDEQGELVSGIELEQIELEIDGEEPDEVALTPFEDMGIPVAVIIVFPVAKRYPEEFFRIREGIVAFLGKVRESDQFGAVAYDVAGHELMKGLIRQKEITALSEKIDSIEDNLEFKTDLFSPLPKAIEILVEEADERAIKYILLISDAEGEGVDQFKETELKIAETNKVLLGEGIRPLVIGYTPDGPNALDYRYVLQGLGKEGDYLEATHISELELRLESARTLIYNPYVLKVSHDTENRPPSGEYQLELKVKLGDKVLEASSTLKWER